jgi:hypothetical protein
MSSKSFKFYLLLNLILISGSLLIKAQDHPLYAPGIAEEHLFLAKFKGEWKLNVAIFQKNGETLFYNGVSENKMILDEHFLHISRDVESEGNVVSSLQILGYDNIKKKFLMMSLDDMENQIKYFEGAQSADKKQITFNNVNLPSNDQYKLKIVFTFERENKYKYEVFGLDGNKEIKTMEIHCIKK